MSLAAIGCSEKRDSSYTAAGAEASIPWHRRGIENLCGFWESGWNVG